jgi:very-short-patch-repair endonuclease
MNLFGNNRPLSLPTNRMRTVPFSASSRPITADYLSEDHALQDFSPREVQATTLSKVGAIVDRLHSDLCTSEPTDAIATAAQVATLFCMASEEVKRSFLQRNNANKIDSLFAEISDRITPHLSAVTPRTLSRLAWSFAVLSVRDDSLFTEIAYQVATDVDRYTPKALAQTAWAFATIGFENPVLFEAVADRASRLTSDFSKRNLANTAWAFAFGAPTRINDVVCRNTLNRFQKPLEWLQVYQALVVAGDIGPSEHFNTLDYMNEEHRVGQLNHFERRFLAWFRETFSAKRWHLDSQSVIAGIAVDFTVSSGNKRLVIECDGDAYHRSRGPDGGKPLGKDVIQDRILTRFGYDVLHVRYYQFQDAGGRNALQAKIHSLMRGSYLL